MEKKVYEGYKRTSTRTKTSTSNTVEKENLSINDNEVVTPKKTPSRRTSASAKPAGRSAVAKPRIAMFIDVDNVGISRENLLEILFFANGKYQIDFCKLYGFSEDTLPGIRDIANEYNMVTVGKMKFKQPDTNCLDSRLLIDAYECALNNKNKIDMIFIWCYPCDLAGLFEKIIALGVNTATIDNSIFDCKNTFVSQTFKLYSPYNFTVGQSTYGKVKNEPSNIAPNDNIEEDSKSNTESVQSVTKPTISTETEINDSHSSQPETIDGVVPPVLPRRTIVERSMPNSPKPEIDAENNDDETNEKPTSLVEEIARKLNLQFSNEDENESNTSNDDVNNSQEEEQIETSNFIMSMLKKVGLDNLVTEKPLNYEDTIGDL